MNPRGSGPSDREAGARDAALRLLAVRARSRRELEGRLRRKSFDDDTIRSVLDALSDVGLIDDAAFARAWADERARLKPVGPARLRHELLEKGVDRVVVERTIDDAYDGDREIELARTAARGKASRLARDDRARARLYRFLLGRGFSREVASNAVNETMEEDEDTGHDVS